MKRIFYLLLMVLVTVGVTSHAQQYQVDAFRLSQTNYGSSARMKAMGNAQIGLGGDISSIGGNPAGMGLFTKSEFSFSPEFNGANSNIDYLGKTFKSNKSRLNINQAAIAWYNPIFKRPGQDPKKGLIGVVFGVGYNRNNDLGALPKTYKDRKSVV